MGDRHVPFTGGSEQWRIAVQAKLDAWLASEEQTLTFSSELSKEERRYLHEQAPKLGLVTKSSGSGEARFITVSKPSTKAEASHFRWLQPSAGALAAMKSFDERHGPSSSYSAESWAEKARAGGEVKLEEVREASRSGFKAAAPPRNKCPPPKPPKPASGQRSGGGLRREREALPAWEYRDEVARLVREHDVVLVTGETGCGKSTQVPQFILDDPDAGPRRVACSQPRRLSAIAVAERVAAERSEAIGGSVGYEVRFESCLDPVAAELVFMTTGVLLRKLASDASLEEFTHVVLDEVHEEDADTEFLLVACRELVRRRQLKLVLMSATLAADKLAAYFADGPCPKVAIGGRNYPVSTFYLEDALAQVGRVQLLCPQPSRLPAKSLEKLRAAAPPGLVGSALACAQCGRTGFASPEELGDHAAECVGELLDASGALDKEEGDSLGADAALRNDLAVLSELAASEPVLEAGAVDPLGGGGLLETMRDDDDDDELGGAFGEAAALLRPKDREASALGGRADASAIAAAVRAYQRSTDEGAVDCDLVRDILKYIQSSSYAKGAVLVFVPGWADIVDLVAAVEADATLGAACHCVALHSSLETAKQKLAFLPPPGDTWKVVVATNVAETSVTIPDVSFVIDAGLEKTLAYDRFLGASVLRTQRISQASARQREGRAGRTRPGVCFRLWTRRRHKSLAPRRKSELLRANLDGLCLRAAALCTRGSLGLAGGARDFLRRALNPPAPAAVDAALADLFALGALCRRDESPSLLGTWLARLPLSPRLGLAALYSRLLGLGPPLVSCVLDAKDPFVKGASSKADFAAGTASDVVALYNAALAFRRLRKYDAAARAFCRKHALSYSSLAIIDAALAQIDRALPSLPKVPPGYVACLPKPQTQPFLLAGALATAALYPNVACRPPGDTLYASRSGARCRLHSSSLAAKKQSPYHSHAPNATKRSQTLVFGALLEFVDANGRAGLAVATASPAAPLAALLVCHADLHLTFRDGTFQLKIPGLACSTTDACLVDRVLRLRRELRAALADMVARRPFAPDQLDAAAAVHALLHAEQAALLPPPADSARPSPPTPTSAPRNVASPAKHSPATPQRKPVYAPLATASRSSQKAAAAHSKRRTHKAS